MHGGKDRNGLLGNVDTSENSSSLRDARKPLVENLRRQVAELEVNMVLLRANTATLTDFKGHGSRHDIARGKVLGGRGVTLHETFTLRVEEIASLTTRTFRDQASGTVDTSWVELDKFQILQRKTGACNHGVTVAGACVGTCAAEVGTSITTGGKDGLVAAEAMKGSILHVESNDANTLAVLHDQVKSEIFNEKVGVVAKGLAVERVKYGMASTIGGGGAAISLAPLAVLEGLATKSTLVNLSLLRPREWDTVVFQLR